MHLRRKVVESRRREVGAPQPSRVLGEQRLAPQLPPPAREPPVRDAVTDGGSFAAHLQCRTRLPEPEPAACPTAPLLFLSPRPKWSRHDRI